MKFFLFLLFFFAFNSTIYCQAINGQLDLRNYDFSTPVSLNGQWKFYWHELTSITKQYRVNSIIRLPSLWNNQIIGLDTLSNKGYATYSLNLRLPDKVMDYGIFVDDMYSAYLLLINGEIVGRNGIVGKSKNDYIPEWHPQVIELPQRSGDLEIILQVSNFDHSKGGIVKDLRFGIIEHVKNEFNLEWYKDIIITSIFIIAAFIFLVRFGFISLDFASLYFSLFCIFYSYRFVGSDLYIINSFIPNISWNMIVALEYISLFACPILLAKHIQALYPSETSSKIINIQIGICTIFTLCVFILPIDLYTSLNIPFFLLMGIFLFYGILIYSSAYINNRPGIIYGLISISVVFSIFVYLVLIYTEILEPINNVAFIGHLLFIVFQSIQLIQNSRQPIDYLAL